MPKINPDDSFIEPSPELCSLVGSFLHCWLLVEQSVNSAVARILRLSNLQGIIVTANVQLPDKLRILEAAASVPPSMAHHLLTSNVGKLVKRCRKLNDDRNRLVHTPFYMTKDGRLHFAIQTARKEIKFNDVLWTQAELKKKIELCVDALTELNELSDSLKGSKPVNYLALVTELAKESGSPRP